MEPLSAAVAKLRSRMIASGRLLNVGVDDDFDPYADIEPVDGGPRCDICRGVRYLRRQVERRDDPLLGTLVRCEACAPYFAQKHMDDAVGTLPKEFRNWTLESFPSQANSVNIVSMLEEWADDPEEPWLYMYSTARIDPRSGRMTYASGRGKTGLAVGLFKRFSAAGKVTAFVYVPDMIQSLKDGFSNPDDASGSERVKAARIADVLVLDDLGAGRASEWANKDVIMPLISSRHANGLRTIITTNLSPTELVDYFEHDRAVTRIEERCTSERGFWVLDMSDMTDLRLNKQKIKQEQDVAF